MVDYVIGAVAVVLAVFLACMVIACVAIVFYMVTRAAPGQVLLQAVGPRPDMDVSGPYPNGSVPYGDGAESPARRLQRFACAAANHHPRKYDGSWCMGYGYVCSRCQMYADPISQRQLDAMCDRLNQLPPDEQQMAAARMSGGGPHGRR